MSGSGSGRDLTSGASERPAGPQPGTGTEADRAPLALSGVTPRAVLIGLGMVLLVGVGAAAVGFRYQFQGIELERTETTRTFLPLAVLLPFFLLVAILNPFLKWIRRGWALRPAELAIIFAMGMAAVTAPIFLLGFGLSILTSPYYFASLENAWEHVLHPYLRSWSLPTNEADAMRWFFEGLPQGFPIPWSAWVPGILWWFALLAAFYFLCLCLLVLFRKQWTVNERLAFPLMELPQAMIEDSDGPSLLPNLFRNRLFWMGFAIPALIYGWNLIHEFYPPWPRLPGIGYYNSISISVARGFPPIVLCVYFAAIGFFYLIPTELLLSVWFFGAMVIVQEGVYNRLGVGLGGTGYFLWSAAASAWQSAGAFIVVVGFSLWIARSHLKEVFRQVWRAEPGGGEGELLSYRTAVWGGLASLVFLLAFFARLGMDWPAMLLFVPFVLVVYIGLTKIVAQVGLFYFVPPMIGQQFTYEMLGSNFLGPQNLVALGYQGTWHGDVQAVFMANAANSTNLLDRIRSHRRRFAVTFLGAAALSILAGTVYIVYSGYEVGAYNFGTGVLKGVGIGAWEDTVSKVRSPHGPSWARMGFLAFGAVLTGALTYLRYRFVWWPFHPVGLAVAASFTLRHMVFLGFVTWVTKMVILRVGSSRLYEQSKPFFFGMILGHMCGMGFPLIMDILLWPTGPATG